MPNFKIRPFRFMFAPFFSPVFLPPCTANLSAPFDRFKRHAATLPPFRRMSRLVVENNQSCGAFSQKLPRRPRFHRLRPKYNPLKSPD